jgi:hypothetical protein
VVAVLGSTKFQGIRRPGFNRLRGIVRAPASRATGAETLLHTVSIRYLHNLFMDHHTEADNNKEIAAGEGICPLPPAKNPPATRRKPWGWHSPRSRNEIIQRVMEMVPGVGSVPVVETSGYPSSTTLTETSSGLSL